MAWWQFSLLGACGGALVELLSLYQSLFAWQKARKASTGKIRKTPAKLHNYVDVPAHTWLLLIRCLLGALASGLFGVSGQITGAVAGIALGSAAPAILAQLGQIPQVRALVRADDVDSRDDCAVETVMDGYRMEGKRG